MAFRQVDERVAYAGDFVTVVQAGYVTEGGERFEREFLRHVGAVAMVPVVEDRRVALDRQFRAAVGRDLLEIPAGLLDVDGEDRELAAVRELAEEVGRRPVDALEELVEYLPMAGMADHRVWIYLARRTVACPVEPHGIEEQHMTIEHVDLDDVDELIASGEISDGKTIIGLLLARARL